MNYYNHLVVLILSYTYFLNLYKISQMPKSNQPLQSSKKTSSYFEFILDIENEEVSFKTRLQPVRTTLKDRSFQKGADIVWDSNLLGCLVLMCEN